MFKLCFFVPESHCEELKAAVFAAGAGKQGDYDSCSWQVLGQGQFRPLAGAKPFLGKQDCIEHVSEYRVEILCSAEIIDAAVQALKDAHPYEEPAYEVYRVEDF